MADFKFTWIKFNQPLQQIPKNAGHLLTPNVLVVADEVFSMANNQLERLARKALPNTLMESTMMRQVAKNRNNPKWLNPSALRQAKVCQTERVIYNGVAGFKDAMTIIFKRSELQR